MRRVMLVDDHQMFLEALRSLLEKVPDLEVVGVAQNGLEVVPMARATQPDIVCMDIGMPGMNGVEATRQLVSSFPEIKVIALSTHVDHIYVTDMMKAGASGYVSKSEGGKELLRAIEAVSMNRTYWCPSATEALARTMNAAGVDTRAVPALGDRELQVLRLVADGLSSAVIAARLQIAPATVEVHRRNIMRKLDLHSAVELTRYAINHGLIDD
jgi:two-component system NarL family response regulator